MTGSLRDPTRSSVGGLTVLHDPIPGPLTAIAVAIRAGSRYDGRHHGIGHLAEHMLFQGTSRFDQATLNRRAAELGGEHDADTGHEDIVFHFEVFNDDVEEALGLLAEQLFASTIPAERLAKEQRVVADEIRGRRDDPANHVHEHAWRRFFGEPLGHAVCGTMRSVRAIDRGTLRRYLAQRFTPSNMILSASGGIARRRLLDAVRRTFPRHPGPVSRRPRLTAARATGTLRLTQRDLTQAYVVRLIALPAEARRLLAVSLAVEMVGADPDARLFQEIRERLGLGYDLGAGIEYGPDWAVAVFSASAAREDEQRLVDTIDRTCREAGAGFGADELARARKKLRYRFARLADSRQDRAAQHAVRALAGLPSLARTARMLATIAAPDVDRAWRAALTARQLTVVLSA